MMRAFIVYLYSQGGAVAYAMRTLSGTARPVTGVITSRLVSGAERPSFSVNTPSAAVAAAAPTECGSKMAGQWLDGSSLQPVTFQHASGGSAGSFFWNTSSAAGKGWKLANGTAWRNGSITLDYNRVVPAGCSPPACR